MFEGKITEQKDVLYIFRILQESGVKVIFGPISSKDENGNPYVTIAFATALTYEMKQDGIDENTFVQETKTKLIDKFITDTKECSFIKFRNIPSVSIEEDVLYGHKYIIFHVRLITNDYSKLIIKKEGNLGNGIR